MAFVSLKPDATPAQMLSLAAAVNMALRGETANTGNAQAAAGSASLTVHDPRCRAGRFAMLLPMNAAAAALRWYLDVENDTAQGSMTFRFTSAPSSAAIFGYAFIGDSQHYDDTL